MIHSLSKSKNFINIISLGFTMPKMQMLFGYLIFAEARNQLYKVKNDLKHYLMIKDTEE
jgi:hypothetical protein